MHHLTFTPILNKVACLMASDRYGVWGIKVFDA